LRSQDSWKLEMSEVIDENNNVALEVIRRKERELAEQLKDAESRAKEKLAAARVRAAEIRQEAESEGHREAEEFIHDEMTRAQQAAAVINDASTREVEQLNRRGAQQLDRAVQTVIDFISPE
jgi:vacuolar-type H+-ATPase subunit H